MASSQEGEKPKLDSPTKKFDPGLHTVVFEHLLEGIITEWEKNKAELEGVSIKEKMKRDERSPDISASKKEFLQDKAKVECILEQMKSVQDEGKLESQYWEMQLRLNVEKAEFVLQEMKWMAEEEGPVSSVLEIQLAEQKAKTKFLLEEIELLAVVEKVTYPMFKGGSFIQIAKLESPMLKLQLKKHIPKADSVLENMKLVQHESRMESPVLRMQLNELERLLRTLKLVQKSGKVNLTLEMELERHIVKLKLLPRVTTLEHEKEGLRSQMLVMELKEHLERLKFLRQVQKNMTLKQHFENETLLLVKIESEREQGKIKSPALGMELKEHTVELELLLKPMKSVKLEEKSKFWELEIELYSDIVKLEHLLEEVKLKEEEEMLRLKEIVAKSEILLEEIRLKQKEEEHIAKLKEYIAEVNSLLWNISYVQEESKVESPALRFQLKERVVKLESLLEKMKMVRNKLVFDHETWEMALNKKHVEELKFLIERMKLKQEKERVLSQELEVELKKIELLVKEIELERDVEILESSALKMRLEGHLGKVKSLLEAMKLERKEEKLEFSALKAQLKERVVQMKSLPKKTEFSQTLGKQLKERIAELKSLSEKIELVQFTGKFKSRTLEIELKKHATKMESLLKEMYLEQMKELDSRTLETELEQHILESERLLKKIESVRDVEILESLVWKMQLQEGSAKAECLIDYVKLEIEKKQKSPSLEIELKQHIAKLESLIVEMKLKQQEKGLEFQMLDIELEEHVMKSELLLKERELICDVEMLKSPVSKVQLKESIAEMKSRLETMKLEREKKKPEFAALEMKLEQNKEKLESSTGTVKYTPREQEALNKHIGPRHVIVIGGRGQYGESLKSVEGYIFLKGRWIELPAMNTPRSFMSSVVVGQEVIVSGGDTGDAITDTIEVLNLTETPLQWKISPVKLPVPLSAHQTVVYRGKLVIIGGHDGNEGRNSDKIYEVLLTPPYTAKILRNLVTPVAWHGAELVGHEIFIFGGGRTPVVPTCAVFVYNLVRNTLRERQSLPRAIKGMATVTRGLRVAVIGGLDDNDQELDEVFIYDTWSGEHRMLPQMNQIRGPCSAIISLTLDTSGSCSADTSSDTLVVLGCPSSPNTVEGYNFDTRTWRAMPPTIQAREFCPVVTTPIDFEFE